MSSLNRGKRVAIVQSNYIPWKGYFDLIRTVDEFLIFDKAQYTRRDWRNRNRIKTPQGLIWLTIPVKVKGRGFQSIEETEISDPDWGERHWKTIKHCYSRATCFDKLRSCFENLYLGCDDKYLSQVNYRFMTAICSLLDINTRLSWVTESPNLGKTERLVELCKRSGATEYFSGPTAKGYIDEQLFADAGIALRWMDYSGYPEYVQLYPPFEHAVSIVDLLFNAGPDATNYMKAPQ